jgi:hypothetical protein
MGWKEAINTYPSSIVYEIHGEERRTPSLIRIFSSSYPKKRLIFSGEMSQTRALTVA